MRSFRGVSETEKSLILDEYFSARRGVLRISECRLRLGDGLWKFSAERAGEIAAHWQRRQAESPALFDGRVLMMRPPTISEHVLSAELVGVDFKSYLYWRDNGFPEADLFDGFGSALIRSAEGHVLLGRQRGGNINAGLAYLPGGFIDGRDVRSDGAVDIAASIAREVAEETGLGADSFTRVPGYIITVCGAQVSIAVEYRSALPAEELRKLILSGIGTQDEPELDDVVIVTGTAAAETENLAEYVRVLLPAVFSAQP